MKSTFRVKPEARAEVREAARWYRERNPDAAARFMRAVQITWERIEEAPHSFPTYLAGSRRALLPEPFSYAVVFHIAGNVIVVTAVAHCKRRPGYWKTR